MDSRTDFVIYCIEEYKSAERLSGKEVVELFNRFKVTQYIRNHYEALHTTGASYIAHDISAYIAARS